MEPPEPLYPNYGNHRNWKFWENYNWHPASQDIRLEFGRYFPASFCYFCLSLALSLSLSLLLLINLISHRWVCREWNARHHGGETLRGHMTHYFFYPVPYESAFPVVFFLF
jgi:hypothetical protein